MGCTDLSSSNVSLSLHIQPVYKCFYLMHSEFKMGDQVEDQQVSCLWQGEYLLSVSLSGHINYLDRNNPDRPLRILKGHNKNLSAIASYNNGSMIYSASFDGRVDILKTIIVLYVCVLAYIALFPRNCFSKFCACLGLMSD